MHNISVVGIDLAKNVFQVYAEDKGSNKVFNKEMKRAQFKKWLSQLPPCLVGMEACSTAHYWGRKFLEYGHQVKLINPRKIKIFVDRNKSDAKDAEAICDATRSKKVRRIPVKTQLQQELSSLHKARSQVVGHRTEISNHLRSQLAEYGLITKPGYGALKRLVEEVLSGCIEEFNCSAHLLFLLTDLYEDLKRLDARVQAYDQELKRVVETNKSAQKLMTLPGIGPITATALVGKIEDFSEFTKGSNFAAWLGLTPKEYSSAGKQRLGGISKQGDRYLRTLLIHGARSVIQSTVKKNRCETSYHRWIQDIVKRRGKNCAAVALANKHARMIWAVMKHDRPVDLSFGDCFLLAKDAR